MIFINYLPKIRLRSTDNSYIKNFIDAREDLFNQKVRSNRSFIQAFIIDAAVRLSNIIENKHLSKILWYLSRHTFHLYGGADVIFSHWFFPKITFGHSKIIFSSGYHPNSYAGQKDEDREDELNQLSLWYEQATAVTYPARSWIDEFTRRRPRFRTKIHYAPHLFRHLKGVSDKADLEKFDNPDKIKILFVGRDGMRKGLDTLISSLLSINETHNHLFDKLDITVISQTYFEEMEGLGIRYSPELSHSEVIREMKQSHIFCLPTKKESFGHVFIEAMACCCAVICDNKNPRTEFFDEGESAMLIEPGNAEQLGQAIISYTSDSNLMKDHVLKNFRKYQSEYSYEAGIKYYKKIFEDCN